MKGTPYQITCISINLIKEPFGKTRAKAKVTLDESIILAGIKVMDGTRGLFVAYPSDPTVPASEGYQNVYYPVTRDLRERIEEAVLLAYQEAWTQQINTLHTAVEGLIDTKDPVILMELSLALGNSTVDKLENNLTLLEEELRNKRARLEEIKAADYTPSLYDVYHKVMSTQAMNLATQEDILSTRSLALDFLAGKEFTEEELGIFSRRPRKRKA